MMVTITRLLNFDVSMMFLKIVTYIMNLNTGVGINENKRTSTFHSVVD